MEYAYIIESNQRSKRISLVVRKVKLVTNCTCRYISI